MSLRGLHQGSAAAGSPGPRPSARRRPPSPCVLALSLLCVSVPRSPLLARTPVALDHVTSSRVTSSYLDRPFPGRVSNHGHTLRSWQDLSVRICGHVVQPVARGPGFPHPSECAESSSATWLLSPGSRVSPEITSDDATATRGIGGNSTQNEHDSPAWPPSQQEALPGVFHPPCRVQQAGEAFISECSLIYEMAGCKVAQGRSANYGPSLATPRAHPCQLLVLPRTARGAWGSISQQLLRVKRHSSSRIADDPDLPTRRSYRNRKHTSHRWLP